MIGLDTNVVIRFLVQDEPSQSAIAADVFAGLSRERPGFISIVVLAEISWVLTRAYKISRQDLGRAIEGLLRSAELVVESAEAAYRALARHQAASSGDFADALIAELARSAGVTETVTFDKTAAASFGMRLLT